MWWKIWNHHPIPRLGCKCFKSNTWVHKRCSYLVFSINITLKHHRPELSTCLAQISTQPNPSILKLKQLSRCRFQIALGNAEFAAYRRSSIDNEKKKKKKEKSNNLTLVLAAVSKVEIAVIVVVVWVQFSEYKTCETVFLWWGALTAVAKCAWRVVLFFDGGRMSSVRAGHTVQKDAFQQKKCCPSARSEWRSLISTSFIFHSSMSHFHKTEVSLPCTSGCGCGTFTRTAWWCFFQQLHDFTSWFMLPRKNK